MEGEIQKLREYFRTGKTKDVSWRKAQLKGLHKFVTEREEDILKALKLDIGKHPVESYRDEIGILIKDINVALANLANWMSGKKLKLPLAAFPSSAELVSEPLGLILIISSWNFPFGLSLEPLIGAIAAGNTAVVKPSELAPASSALLAQALPEYLDSEAIKVIEGGVDVSNQLLQYKWDKIFFTGVGALPMTDAHLIRLFPILHSCHKIAMYFPFGTGSRRVGQIVMAAAVKHLTPVTLELGGKCPMIIDSLPNNSWLKKVVLNRLVSGKFGTCNGQTCVGIDYILVEKRLSSNLVESLKNTLEKTFKGKPEECVARIINKHQFGRLKGLLDDPQVRNSIIYGGSANEDKLYIEPTILIDPPLDAEIMTEEIFGPLLPIITMENIEDSIEFINSKPKPLTIYCFTNNNKLMQRVASETSSGSLVFNDTVIQYAAETMPFGGVGDSGFGRYHGKCSFDSFSHEKPILKRALFPDFWFRYPPWNNQKLELFRAAYIFNYFYILLIALGLKKSRPLPNI